MAPENSSENSFASPFFAGSPFGAPAQPPAPVAAEQAAPGASFGLVFQAPTETRTPRRERRPRNEQSERPEVESVSEGAEVEAETERPARKRRDQVDKRERNEKLDNSEGESSESADVATDSDDDDDQTPRRRRRGGRGRKNSKDSNDSGVNTSDEDDESGGETGSDSDESDDAGSRKRTRRRRRSGAAGAENDDPNTVVKVREPRRARDEVTSIKGSTRLEAKKQRRREGREAGRRRTVITEAEFLARRESVDRVMVVRERDGRTQIGVLEDGVLAEHYVSRQEEAASMAGNVYLGRVQNVLPSMEAAFVDIGRGRNAVLYAGEVNWDAAGLDNQPKRIEHALKSGESVLVQVTKDPIGHKGARLTSQISLPGRYLVYVPGNSMTGISRKLPDTERARLKKILKEIVPSDAGVIVRTAAEGASEEELRADVERLTTMWEKIQKKAETGAAPSLLHGEPDLTVRVIRDVFNEDFNKMIVSGEHAWNEVHSYISDVAPDLVSKLERWTGEKDIFAANRIDEQLAKAMDRMVWLPSGGSLVIDRTEAMTVVDVNTGKFIGAGGNLEETVTKNNIEAAEEIVRQLRLRDIGGIIVIDFIDMVLESNRDLVVRRLLECLGRDRTKHQVAEVTSLGLVQMTRKRVGSGLVEVFSEPCDHCHGRGIVIHDRPVENRDINGNGMGGRKTRKQRGRDQAISPAAAAPEAKKSEDGGFAHIAAAAHAAAISTGDKQASSAPVSLADSSDAVMTAGSSQQMSKTSVPQQGAAAPAPRKRRSRRAGAAAGAPGQSSQDDSAQQDAAISASAVESAVTPDAPRATENKAGENETVTSPVVNDAAPLTATTEPKKRRGSRRAASSAGAPVALKPVDLSVAPAQSTTLTKVAGDVAEAPREVAPKAPARKKRGRVSAPAGAPTSSQAMGATGE